MKKHRELLVLGAQARLAELDTERKALITKFPELNGGVKHVASKTRKQSRLKPQKKGFSYRGKHWTQKPENADRLRAAHQKSLESRARARQVDAEFSNAAAPMDTAE